MNAPVDPSPPLARVLLGLLVLAVTLVLLGAPVWAFMHGSASGWTDERTVLARVAAGAECRTGPPPGDPRTCDATWRDGDAVVEGEVSDRYGGPEPRAGEDVEARVVGDGLAFTGYQGALLGWGLAAPYLAVGGLALGALAVAGLVRIDPRWAAPGGSRPGRPPAETVRTARATPGTGRRRSAAPPARRSRAAGGSGRHTARRRAPRRRRRR